MKVVHVSYSTGGGAGRAASRLVEAQRSIGIESVLAVPASTATEASTLRLKAMAAPRWRAHLDRLSLRCYQQRSIYAWWSNDVLPSRVVSSVSSLRPDIVHLHWIGDGMLRTSQMAMFGRPVVWTLHDMWPFTGGCHYSGSCVRFESGCGNCPQLGSSRRKDLSRSNHDAKASVFSALNCTAVAPSHWMAACAGRSSLLRAIHIEIIPNTVPLVRFMPGDRSQARSQLGIGASEIVVVAGVSGPLDDQRKGIAFVPEAARQLQSGRQDRTLRFVTFGGGRAGSISRDGLVYHHLGSIGSDHDLARVYRAADLVVVPSIQDNLPNIAVEAMACGTPVVGFDSGGLPEIIKSPSSGVVADSVSAAGLARAMADCLAYRVRNPSAASVCREHAKASFSPELIGRRHLSLYESVLESARHFSGTRA